MNGWRRHALGIALFATAATAAMAAGTAWWMPSDERSALQALGDLEGARAVAVGADGAIAVAAFADGKRGERSTLRIAGESADGVETLELPGEVRALRFADGGRELLVILAKRSKRRPPETELFSIDLDSLRARRRLHLPHSAAAMTFWPARSALVVTARDEIRTFLLPDYNSGPLFRVPGDHRSIEPIADSTFAVATGPRVIVVDLTDDPTEDGLPIRATLDAGAVVEEVAVLGATPRVAVRREGMEPTRLALPGSAFVAPPPRVAEPDPDLVPESVASVVEPREEPPVAETVGTAATAAAPPIVAEIRDDPPRPAPATDLPDETAAAVAGEETARVAPVDDVREEVVATSPGPGHGADADAAIRGRVSGEDLALVLAVVAYGPDNVVREAARVAPRSDGSYAFPDLAPGSYRVVLDGGGDRLIESEPPFQILRVGDDGGVSAKPFTILRVR